jgi:hypothetical protein
MALWTSAWELQRQEGRLMEQLTRAQRHRLEQQTDKQSVAVHPPSNSDAGAATSLQGTCRQGGNMLVVGLHWAAEALDHRVCHWWRPNPRAPVQRGTQGGTGSHCDNVGLGQYGMRLQTPTQPPPPPPPPAGTAAGGQHSWGETQGRERGGGHRLGGARTCTQGDTG